jgi:hypothetical protein
VNCPSCVGTFAGVPLLFCFPTAVDFNPATDEIIVADSQRNRLQVYKKVRDYQDFQANL